MTKSLTYLLLILIPLGGNPVAAQPLWEFQTDGMIQGKATISDNTIYVAGGKSLYALDLQGNLIWKKELGAMVAARITLAGDTMYVHSTAGLHALNRSGEQQWFFAKADNGPLVAGKSWGWGDKTMDDPWGWYRSAPLVTDGSVYFGSDDGLYAVAAEEGNLLWHAVMGPVTADPTSYKDTVIVGSWDNTLYSVDAQSGETKWAVEAQLPRGRAAQWIGYYGFNLSPTVYEDAVFVGARGTYFYALSADKGEELWSVKVGTSWIGSSATVTEGTVYFGLSDGKSVLGYNRKGGEQNTFLDVDSLVFAQPEMFKNELIIGTLSGQLFRLDTITGSGEQIITLTEKTGAYNSYFHPDNQPQGMDRHQATAWSVDKMLTDFNAVLNLTIHGEIVYLSTGSGKLYAVPLSRSIAAKATTS